MGRNRGFSLVGAIVIIAIVIVLLFFLVPKLNKSGNSETIAKVTKKVTKAVEKKVDETKKKLEKKLDEKLDENSKELAGKKVEADRNKEEKPIRIIKPPKVLKKVYPGYPKEAKDKRIQGVVVLECQTDAKGEVEAVKVLKGHPELNQAAVDAAKQWKFKPFKIDGVPKPVKFTLTIRFSFN